MLDVICNVDVVWGMEGRDNSLRLVGNYSPIPRNGKLWIDGQTTDGWTDRQTEKLTERKTVRQTDRHADKETDRRRHADKETDRRTVRHTHL